ncbi:uncharacterized protein LOC142907955 isoform X1 [Petromyzon marinus]|uniref:uncharacterized protein LOC142907955 isoform X1 n=1 Tax=Petromyzon marinus TaxID=7757 RepID=UPI003F730258
MMEPPHELGYCAQRFPLRARHNRGLGSGHWLAARFPRGPPAGHHEPPEGHREPPEGHRLLGWPCLGPPSGWGCPPRGSQPAGPGPSRPGVPVDERRRVLDRGLLLRLHGVETPPDLCTVDVTDQHLDQVSESDLAAFDSVGLGQGRREPPSPGALGCLSGTAGAGGAPQLSPWRSSRSSPLPSPAGAGRLLQRAGPARRPGAGSAACPACAPSVRQWPGGPPCRLGPVHRDRVMWHTQTHRHRQRSPV